MLALLHANFGRAAPERGGHSLQIGVGRSGARLSHSHASQYAYVEQARLHPSPCLSLSPDHNPDAAQHAYAL